MTTIACQVIADSVSPQGKRLTTIKARYPRFIHSELMTHRVFSRNASSSRAIPVSKLIADVRDNPVIPIHWGKNEPGMQANSQLEGTERQLAKNAWDAARFEALAHAHLLNRAGAHKQIINRILEPFAHITVVITATEWANFLALRDHKDAEPHIALLANEIKRAIRFSDPEPLKPGQWHLPFTKDLDQTYHLSDRIKVSVARCASVSYKTVDGLDMTMERAVALHDKLLASAPLHASPAEHQATPDLWVEGFKGPYGEWRCDHYAASHMHGNLKGWCQYRKLIPGENIQEMPL